MPRYVPLGLPATVQGECISDGAAKGVALLVIVGYGEEYGGEGECMLRPSELGAGEVGKVEGSFGSCSE